MSDPSIDADAAAKLKRRGHLAFNWADLDRIELPSGIVTQMYRLTDAEDAPTVFNVYYPPGCIVDAHTHATDYTEIILEGSQRVGATWHQAGDIRIGLANRGYGPLEAGPDGARVLFMFKDGRWPAIALGNNDPEALGSSFIEAHLARKRQ
ncbi:MAG: hypothetical protein AAF993_15820 [Pseudomonadota bacterium]